VRQKEKDLREDQKNLEEAERQTQEEGNGADPRRDETLKDFEKDLQGVRDSARK